MARYGVTRSLDTIGVLYDDDVGAALKNERRLIAQNRVDLRFLPEVERAFARVDIAVALAVGREARAKAAIGQLHFAQRPGDRLIDALGEKHVSRRLPQSSE